MRNREELQVQQLSTNSRLVAAAVLHEIRNFCGAISVVYSNLKERSSPCRVEEIQGLETLINGLGRVASLELYGKGQSTIEEVPLQQVLDDLRIVIEPNWHDSDGCVTWNVPDSNVRVLADRYGLMQVFMNLAQNSHRAVQASAVRRLTITVAPTWEARAGYVSRYGMRHCGPRPFVSAVPTRAPMSPAWACSSRASSCAITAANCGTLRWSRAALLWSIFPPPAG